MPKPELYFEPEPDCGDHPPRPPEPLAPKRECGDCTLCCKVMKIEDEGETFSPRGEWCQHARPGACKGCSIYEQRPKDCREFSCTWLLYPDVMPENLKPNRCKAVIDERVEDIGWISVHVDESFPNAWKRGALGRWIERMIKKVPVAIILGDQRRILADGRIMPQLRQLLKRAAFSDAEISALTGGGMTRHGNLADG